MTITGGIFTFLVRLAEADVSVHNIGAWGLNARRPSGLMTVPDGSSNRPKIHSPETYEMRMPGFAA